MSTKDPTGQLSRGRVPETSADRRRRTTHELRLASSRLLSSIEMRLGELGQGADRGVRDLASDCARVVEDIHRQLRAFDFDTF